MAEAQSTANSPAKGGAGRGSAKVRTAGENTPGGRPGRPRGGSARSRPVRRPGAPSAGAGARLLAPLALIVCVIAVLAVLSGGGSDTASTTQSNGTQSSSQESAPSDSSGDSSAATASTGPVRSTYRVKPGDSFAAIAEKTGVDVKTLAELNPDVDPRALQPGQKLKLK